MSAGTEPQCCKDGWPALLQYWPLVSMYSRGGWNGAAGGRTMGKSGPGRGWGSSATKPSFQAGQPVMGLLGSAPAQTWTQSWADP